MTNCPIYNEGISFLEKQQRIKENLLNLLEFETMPEKQINFIKSNMDKIVEYTIDWNYEKREMTSRYILLENGELNPAEFVTTF